MKKICLVIGCVCLSLAAHADVFLVQKVPVDVTSDSSARARDEALSLAQQKAFEILIQRITRAEDSQRLEWPVAEDIVNWVSDVSMSNEKTSSVRYIADVNVRFDVDKIKAWLEEKKVPYMAQAMEPAVVELSYQGPEIEGLNPWVQAWQNAYNSQIVPLSAQTATDEVSEGQQPNKAAFSAVATVYPDKVQVHFKPTSSANTILSEISLIQPLPQGKSISWEKLVQKLQTRLEKMWLDKNIVHFDKPSFISVIIPIKDLSEWIKIREHLDKIKLIKKYDVRAMRKDQAQIDVFFAGQLDVFIKAMDQENLFLSKTPESDFWILRSSQDVSKEEKEARVLPTSQILFPVVMEEQNAGTPKKIQIKAPDAPEEAPAKLKAAQPQAETQALINEDSSE